MNYIKKYYVVALVINNNNVYGHIKESKAARGRFVDYAIRRMIKEIVESLIKLKNIDPNTPIKLIINIDQQSTKSNGYYNLHDGLVEELKYGIVNFNYSTKINPIVFSNLEIKESVFYDQKHYIITEKKILLKSDIRMSELLSESERDTLIIMTCAGEDLGNGDATERLILTAKRL